LMHGSDACRGDDDRVNI